MPAGSLLVAVGAGGIFTVVVFYPLCVLLSSRRHRTVSPPAPTVLPSVTVVTAARNAAALLDEKIKNFCSLDYPPDRLSLLIASDASTDSTRQIVESARDPRILLVEQEERRGKAAAMNRAVQQADSDLLLFSDADAHLAPDAVRKLVRHFSDPQVGGVCGLRVSARSAAHLRDAQQTYIHLDSALKKAESAQGHISSNDGKIHMIRRSLFAPIPPDVTDDLYTALSVISQGYRFLFEPEAVAEVTVPSRDARHEIQRRRRIVTRSLTGIFRMRSLLNPSRFGWFSIGLLINKVGRRFLPFFLLLLLAGLLRVTLASTVAIPLLYGAALFLLGLAACALGASLLKSKPPLKPINLVLYVLAGLTGTAWGAIDFLCGRRVSVWEPKKTDGGAA